MTTNLPPLAPECLPAGVRSRFLEGVNGLRVHVLEAGDPTKPMLLLLHGFPEIAFSWRRLIPGLATAGYYVVAPDARGYGRTTGSALGYDIDLSEFSILNLVRDAAAIVAALGRDHVDLVAGHDYGAGTAAACALIRPDIFRSLALMSAPFGGPPKLLAAPLANPDPGLAALDPPRKHYHWYYATRAAAADMDHSPQGVRRCGAKEKGVFERTKLADRASAHPTYRCRRRLRSRKGNGTIACRGNIPGRAPQPGGRIMGKVRMVKA